MELTMLIDENGDARFIYDDTAMEIALALGVVSTKRASHVEPTPDGQWTADMNPVAGPMLGPFQTRKQALQAEHQYLERQGLPPIVN